MARGKKKEKKELTPEERLQQALVPEEKWPYELPEGWKWVKLEGIAEVIMGQSPSGADTTDDSSCMPLIGGASDMGLMYPNTTRYTKMPTKTSEIGDLILCVRATLGRAVFSDKQYCLGRGVASIRVNSECIISDFLRHYFTANERYLYENATGSTFLQVTRRVLQTLFVPVPTLNSQKMISKLIDLEFRRLDEVKDQIQSVLDSSEEKKQSILHKAFTGELTEKWRSKQQVSLSSWRYMPIKDVCYGLKYGTSSKSKKEGKIAVIRMGNLQDGEIDWSSLVYSNNVEDNEKYFLHPGDVLFNRTNSPELVGKTSIYRGEKPAIYAGYLIKLDYKEFIDYEFS